MRNKSVQMLMFTIIVRIDNFVIQDVKVKNMVPMGMP